MHSQRRQIRIGPYPRRRLPDSRQFPKAPFGGRSLRENPYKVIHQQCIVNVPGVFIGERLAVHRGRGRQTNAIIQSVSFAQIRGSHWSGPTIASLLRDADVLPRPGQTTRSHQANNASSLVTSRITPRPAAGTKGSSTLCAFRGNSSAIKRSMALSMSWRAEHPRCRAVACRRWCSWTGISSEVRMVLAFMPPQL